MNPTESSASLTDLVAMDWVADTMLDRPVHRVRRRLTAQLGNAVADSFEIVPSDRVDNQLATVALLLPHHLPILVAVHDRHEHGCFLVAQYDIAGHRLHGTPDDGDAMRYHSLADAILASGRAFEQLKEWAEQRQICVDRRPHELAEERWLRHQLAACRDAFPAFAAVHHGGGSSALLC